MTTTIQGLLEANARAYDSYRYEGEFEAALRALWEPAAEEPSLASFSQDLDGVCFLMVEPEPLAWTVAFTPTFSV